MGETIGPPLWPHKPGEITIRRNGYGHYSVIIDAKQVATVCGSSDFQCRPLAAAVADYARCRAVADAAEAHEATRRAILRDLPPLRPSPFPPSDDGFGPGPDPCPAADLDAEDRRLLLAYSGNPVWSHAGVFA